MKRVVVLFAALCVAGADVLADPVHDAEDLAAKGDFVGAAARYRAAYAADPRADLLCNVGVAYYKAKDLPRAHLFLSRCLDRGTNLEASFVTTVRSVLTAVEQQLKAGDFTPVDIFVDPDNARVAIAAFAADETFTGSHLVWLPFGSHHITVSLEGYYDASQDIVTADHDTLVIRPKLEKKPPDVIEKAQPIRTRKRSMLPAIGASTFTLGAIIFAGVSYKQAHDRAAVSTFALGMDVFQDDKDYVDSHNTRMLVGGLLAIAGGAASGYLWYRALTPVVVSSKEGATVALRFEF